MGIHLGQSHIPPSSIVGPLIIPMKSFLEDIFIFKAFIIHPFMALKAYRPLESCYSKHQELALGYKKDERISHRD